MVTHQLECTINDTALLSGTLRTYQKAACDDEVVTLRCPQGTIISIQLAQYGKSTPDLCNTRTKQVQNSTRAHGVPCYWPSAAQSGNWDEVAQETWGKYSLLQTVVEACQKKRQCKFQASPKTFGGDPCPGTRKYVEVAYKCRPYEFRSKVACENERIQLKCNPNSRLAVYSASYGRTEYESIQCPQPQGVPEETCLVGYATETVMQLCHGKRSCEMAADIGTFGSPCRPESRMYLKVVYTCVPRKVLKEEYEGMLEPDEAESNTHLVDDIEEFGSYDAGNEFIRESAASPPTPNLNTDPNNNLTKDLNSSNGLSNWAKGQGFASFQSRKPPRATSVPVHDPTLPKPSTKGVQNDNALDPNCTVTIYAGERTRVIGFVSEWINAYTFVSQNQERFYLYLIISVAAGVLLCLTLLVARLLVQRHRARREAKFHATNVADNSLPNGFTDDISEVDADIDLTTPGPGWQAVHEPVPVGSIAEVVRYPHGHTHTLRRMPESDAPRSLSTGTNTHYYYG